MTKAVHTSCKYVDFVPQGGGSDAVIKTVMDLLSKNVSSSILKEVVAVGRRCACTAAAKRGWICLPWVQGVLLHVRSKVWASSTRTHPAAY